MSKIYLSIGVSSILAWTIIFVKELRNKDNRSLGLVIPLFFLAVGIMGVWLEIARLIFLPEK